MSDSRNKDKSKYTSEDYQEIARKHQDALKSNKRIFWRTGLFAAAAVIIMILIVLAWFVANNRADAIGSAISAINSRYVLVTGTDTDNIGFWERGNAELDFNLSDSMKVNSDSNLRNTTGTGRLSPGASGRLVFTVEPIAKDLNGVVIDIEQNLQFRNNISDDEAARYQTLLKGHILFFREKTDRHYSSWISPDDNGKYSFTINRGAFVADGSSETTEPVTCTVYWVWPQQFHNMVYTGGSTYYKNLFENTLADGYQKLIGDMNTFHNKYLYEDRQGISISQSMSGDDYIYCTEQYNLADENIGINVDYIQVRFNTHEAVTGVSPDGE